jgi:transmembrane sensor
MTDTPSPSDDIAAQAVLWLVRVGDPDFVDWAGFELWLAADPAHADAYHAAADAESRMVATLAQDAGRPTATPAVDRTARSMRRHAPWLGGALAASLVLVASFAMLRPGAVPTVYETGPGAHREAVLADGSRIALNGGTRVTVAANDPRTIRLERGEALFTVRHDPAHPFTVAVGDSTIADVGTVFDVVRDRSATVVAVGQGTVLWNPSREAVRLEAGYGLRADDAGGTIERAPVDVASVGGWTRDQLSYDGAPMAAVAADLSRSLGVAITVSPDAAMRPVRGVLALQGGADVAVPRLAALLGLHARRDDHGWRLSSSP